MARINNRLSAVSLRTKKPGMHADGRGLWLQVTNAGARSWIFRYTLAGRAREMGLGSLSKVSLADARIAAHQCRQLLGRRIDPIEARKAAQIAAQLAAAQSITFKECAERYIAANEAAWRNQKHRQQWPNTLEAQAYPIVGKLPVQSIDTTAVMRVLEQEIPAKPEEPALPLWRARPETASRLRGRIEAVLNWAKSRGYRDGDNPARWRGHLENLLPRRSKVRGVQHHSALPYRELYEFMKAIRTQEGTAARALEFTILTAARTSEALGARWNEIDFDTAIWTIPADRIKAGKEHRVPLSEAAIALLHRQQKLRHDRDGGFAFQGGKLGQPLSNMAMLALVRRMQGLRLKGWRNAQGKEITPHGFRSTFRDWAAECTHYPREVAEMALAHTIGDKVEAAYRRGDLFERRKALMHDWATFCATPQRVGNVVPLARNTGESSEDKALPQGVETGGFDAESSESKGSLQRVANESSAVDSRQK